jgi:hypothetical protein
MTALSKPHRKDRTSGAAARQRELEQHLLPVDGRDRAYRQSAQTPWQVPTCAAANPSRAIVALLVIRRSSSDQSASSRSIGGGFVHQGKTFE